MILGELWQCETMIFVVVLDSVNSGGAVSQLFQDDGMIAESILRNWCSWWR